MRHRLGSRLSLLITMLLLIQSFMWPSAASGAATFPDVDAKHWAAADIEYLYNKQIFIGFPDGTFRPSNPISRGEFLTVIARVISVRTQASATNAVQFTPANHWALETARQLASAGVVRSTDGETIDLWAPITRGEMARWLVRAKDWETQALQLPLSLWFTDVGSGYDARMISFTAARGILVGYPDRTFHLDEGATRAEAVAIITRVLDPGRRPASNRAEYSIPVNGVNVPLSVVQVNLRRPGLKPTVLFGHDRVGGDETLGGMARRHNALAAATGSFFQSSNPNYPKDPYGTIVTGGDVVHIGAKRAAIGFWPGGRAGVGNTNPTIRGTVTTNEGTASWYAYNLNHHRSGYDPGSWSIIYTPARGADIMMNEGLSVIVENGIVRRVAEGNVPIPAGGFVINLGGQARQELAGLFKVGARVEYQVQMEPEWQGVAELLQAGPRLVKDGKVSIDFAAEEFTEPRIVSLPAERTALALTRDGYLLMITTPPVRMVDLAQALTRLGVADALGMDGGGSSGLFHNGTMIRTPGRTLSNVLSILQ